MAARSSGAVLQGQLDILSRLGVVGDLTVLQAMFWTKPKASGLVGLMLAALAVGAGAALAYQVKEECPIVRSQKAPQQPATLAVRPPEEPRPGSAMWRRRGDRPGRSARGLHVSRTT